MTLPPDWPLGLPDDLAARYESGARALYKIKPFRDDPILFDRALTVALDYCEKARLYHWPERAELERQRRLVEEWPGAIAGARKFAAALEKMDTFPGTFLLVAAARKAGMKVKSSNQPHIAIAELLRELSETHLRLVGRGGYSLEYGSLRVTIQNGKLPYWPSRAVVLAISLAHLLRLVADSDPCARTMVIYERQDIGKVEGWDAAAAFALCVGLAEDDGDPDRDQVGRIRAAAERWRTRHKGRLCYIGWRKPKDRSGKKKSPSVRGG